MRRFLPYFLKSRRGNAAIEFAFTLPVILLLIGGIVEFGRAFQVYGAVNRLATRYAIAWADCSDSPTGTCNTELAMYTSPIAMQNLVPQLTNAITLRMIEVQMAGTTPTVLYASPVGATLNATELPIALSAIASGQTGVVVTVGYTHTLIFFQTLMAPILGATRTISYSVAQLKS